MTRPLMALFVVLSAACGMPGAPNDPAHPLKSPSSVLGGWRWPQTSTNLMLTTVLESDTFGMTAACTGGGVSLTASTSSPAVVDDTTIDVETDAHDIESLNGATCEATLKATTFTWRLTDLDTLELTAQGQPPLTLTRVRN